MPLGCKKLLSASVLNCGANKLTGLPTPSFIITFTPIREKPSSAPTTVTLILCCTYARLANKTLGATREANGLFAFVLLLVFCKG